MDNKPVKDAPIPRVTSKTGNAQQVNVLKLVKRLRDGVINCLNILILTTYLFEFIA